MSPCSIQQQIEIFGVAERSVAHFTPSPLAGSGWNENERIKRQQHYDCGYTLYGWDGDTLAWEHRPVRHAGETGRIIHYLYEPGSFVPVVQAIRLGNMSLHKQPVYSDHYRLDEDPLWATQPEPEPFSELLWYQCDHLGTPQELTNQQGEIVWRAQHKAWGETQVQGSDWAQHKGIQNPLRFQGQYHDHETGLHYNRYRYYDPLVGRFISKDPIGYAGGLNLYVYAPNPVFWIDPFGLAKRGPKTQGAGPHNEMIAAWGKEVKAEGGTVIAGGGIRKEILIRTPGGIKEGRRPDIIYTESDGALIYGNVGKVRADGETPITREMHAMNDLTSKTQGNDVPSEVRFRAYNCCLKG